MEIAKISAPSDEIMTLEDAYTYYKKNMEANGRQKYCDINDTIINAGSVHKHIYLQLKGCSREYYQELANNNKKQKEISYNFYLPNDAIIPENSYNLNNFEETTIHSIKSSLSHQNIIIEMPIEQAKQDETMKQAISIILSHKHAQLKQRYKDDRFFKNNKKGYLRKLSDDDSPLFLCGIKDEYLCSMFGLDRTTFNEYMNEPPLAFHL